MIEVPDIRRAEVRDRIWFQEEKKPYRVRARSDRYMVCTKPFNPMRTVLYSIVDLERSVRGPENLILGAGAETDEQCENMILRLEGKCEHLGFTSEVSRRREIGLRVSRVGRPQRN